MSVSRRPRSVVAAAVACVVVAAACTPESGSAPVAVPPTSAPPTSVLAPPVGPRDAGDSARAEIAFWINEVRAERGLDPVVFHDSGAAQVQAFNMASAGRIGHDIGPDGTVVPVGTGVQAASALLTTSSSGRGAVASFVASEAAHRLVLLSPDLRGVYVGAACAGTVMYVSLHTMYFETFWNGTAWKTPGPAVPGTSGLPNKAAGPAGSSSCI